MMFRRFLAFIALSFGLGAHAAGEGPFPVGNIGTLDNNYVYLYGWHPGDLGDFADVFSFQSSGAGWAAGLIIPLPDANIPPADLAGIDFLALLDSNYQLLPSGYPFAAYSTDPATNFVVLGWMPGAGTYELAVVGKKLTPGSGFYYAAVATQLVPVPEPGSSLLVLAGLVVVAGGFVRRGASVRAARLPNVRDGSISAA
jgi:hypothetical protein